LTLLAIGAGILINNKGLSDQRAEARADMKDLRAELKADIADSEIRIGARIDRLESRLNARLNAIESELLHFSELKGHLEGRIDEIARIATERAAA
jgi:hypothetical protein